MNENHKTELDELLNDLVDEYATDRQKTEFKRLAQHDPVLEDQLVAMRNQKNLLNALPIESAPASLVEDVSALLERKLILGDMTDTERTVAGTSHLYMRRILTTAAMLLLPLGLLSLVVYEIMKPPSGESATYVPASEMLAQDNPEKVLPSAPAVDKALPFDGTLTFTTDQPMVVSDYIEGVITDSGLNSFPGRTAEATTFQIAAPPEIISKLITSLKKVWYNSSDAVLNVAANSRASQFEIQHIQVDQINELIAEDDGDMFNCLAEQYASANGSNNPFLALGQNSEENRLDEEPLRLAIPILTERSDSTPPPAAVPQPTIRLKIQVKQNAR